MIFYYLFINDKGHVRGEECGAHEQWRRALRLLHQAPVQSERLQQAHAHRELQDPQVHREQQQRLAAPLHGRSVRYAARWLAQGQGREFGQVGPGAWR